MPRGFASGHFYLRRGPGEVFPGGLLVVCLVDDIGEGYKFSHGELFGAFGEERVFESRVVLREHAFERAAEHFSALAEGGFDHGFEQAFVAAEVGDLVSHHANNARFHLRRRIEHIFVDSEKIFDVVPRLQEHREYAIGFGARAGGKALCHLALQHTAAAHHLVFIVEHLEENLRRYVVRIVSDDAKFGIGVNVAKVEFQEVVGDNITGESGEIGVKIIDRFAIEFHHLQVVTFLHQELRKNAHTGTNFENRHTLVKVERVGYTVGDREVGEEVLAQGFFCFNLLHKRIRKIGDENVKKYGKRRTNK